MDRELDSAATGPRWLQDERVAQCVADALQYGSLQLGLYELRSWVLMINHVHILIYPKANLSKITKSIKNFSARQANAILGRTARLLPQLVLIVWGRLATCGGLVIRLVQYPEYSTGRLPIGRRLPTCPTKLVCVRLNKSRRGEQRFSSTGQPFWQDESYNHWVRTRDELETIVRYIEENPVRASLVKSAEDWRWSSAFSK